MMIKLNMQVFYITESRAMVKISFSNVMANGDFFQEQNSPVYLTISIKHINPFFTKKS